MPALSPAITLESLPLPQRLALAYAPRRFRADVLALLLLDGRLAAILRAGGEVMISQIKLAWWRDRLGEDPALWPAGEPLLELLGTGKVDPRCYLPLVDGWERLLDDDLTASGVGEFAEGRALAWSALAQAHAAPAVAPSAARAAAQAAREISYLDLATHLGQEDEARAARQLALACKWHRPNLPRALRPLAVLHALSRRALHRDGHDLLDGPGAALVALRIGLFGR